MMTGLGGPRTPGLCKQVRGFWLPQNMRLKAQANYGRASKSSWKMVLKDAHFSGKTFEITQSFFPQLSQDFHRHRL